MRLFFIFFSLLNILFSQASSVLEVSVIDHECKESIEGAVIKFENLPFSGVTGKDGRFIVKNMPLGEWSLLCSFVGYKTERRIINISGDRQVIEIILNRDQVEIPEILITGTRASEKGSSLTFSNITKLEIERISVNKDIPSILSTLPSTSFYSESGTGIGYGYIRIRGFDQRRISVLINGVPQNDPEDHSVYWINFYDLANSLEDVQVQRGSTFSFYGPPAIGASINLVTNKPLTEPNISFEVSTGSFNTKKYALNANTGLVAERFMFRLRASKVESDGYRDWSWSKFWRFFFTASYYDDNQSLSLNAYGGPQEDGLAFYGISKKLNSDENRRKYNYGFQSQDREVLNQPQISIVHDLKLGEKLWLKNTIFYLSGDGFFDFNANYGTIDYFRLDNSIQIPNDIKMRAFVDNDQYGWMPQVEYSYKDGKVFVGGEVRLHRSLHWGRIESGTGLPENVVGEKGNRHFYEYSGGKNIYSIFFSFQRNINGNLNINAKVQTMYQEYRLYNEKYVGTDFTTPYLFVNPQIGLNYSINENASVYTSVSFTRREPPLKNLYEAESASWGVTPQFEKDADGSYNFHNPLVKPESLLNFEVGTRFAFKRLNFSLNFYLMNFENEIVPSGGLDVFGQPRVGNAGRTRHIGIEFEGIYQLPLNFNFSFNGNFSRNRYLEFIEYSSSGNTFSRNGNFIANAPEIILNAGLNFIANSFFASLNVNYTGTQFTDNSMNPDLIKIDEVTVDPFTVVNFTTGINHKIFGSNIKLIIELNNLFDTKYLMNGFGWDNFFPAAGRNINTTLKFEL